MSVEQNKPSYQAWVMFSGKTELWWLKFLKPGFRHCYLLLNDGQRWVSYDPLSPHTEIAVHYHVPADFDLPGWLVQREQIAVPAALTWEKRKPAPLMLFNCVEAVKRVLGLHKRDIITPWQLYQYLKHNHQGEHTWAQ